MPSSVLAIGAVLTIMISATRAPAQGLPPSARPLPPSDSLGRRIVRQVTQHKDAVIGVAFHDLSTGDTLFINADDSFHAASTMKVPVMIELYRQVDAGRLRLDRLFLLANHFT